MYTYIIYERERVGWVQFFLKNEYFRYFCSLLNQEGETRRPIRLRQRLCESQQGSPGGERRKTCGGKRRGAVSPEAGPPQR